ncbi:MAG TPA: Na+/H+ antiporter subunit E [Hydrogenophaga sp.]|uniref:Na+/H+ antiporter subunit E n=1 Tax=Hydrogenophaga sp. TaxID=1904254 RepID=UPI002D0C9879|nr:Na+/H+ antiporter subunit E [Hydrogenophaga sp.]HMN91682.1 Na+/H+ antiporter subunit E [Hydrogenophaga sp.]HMP11246.1 Na+/H+ antiporter subunit E [Hydrogenophaga sp.]
MKDASPVSLARRWFPHPVLSLQLGVSWLVLSHSVALVHWLSALLVAWAVPRLLAPFLGDASRIHWPTTVRLILTVLWDIVVANVAVARITLGSMQKPRPAWLRVPLETDHPRVNALFATIITTTPGTVCVTVCEGRREILVHALDCDDGDAMVADMKARYEAPLLRIFRLRGSDRPGRLRGDA